MALKALILDVDGTIAETADVKRAAFNQAFAEIGLDWVWGRAVLSYCQIWCLRIVGHAAIWSGFVVSIPSLNVTPVMTLAR